METTPVLPAETTSVVKIEEFKSLISQAPTALAENNTSYTKAIAKGNELIELAKQGMNDVIDDEIASYITKAKNTKKIMNEKRSPFTQMMTLLAKEFTSLESGIDKPIDTLQAFRDGHATNKIKERQAAERLAQLKLAKEQEAIEIERLYRIGYSTASSEYILNFKTSKNEWFNALTLLTVDNASAEIAQFDNRLSDAQFVFPVQIPLTVQYHSIEEKVMITGGLAQQLCYTSMADFKTAIAEYKRELTDMLPSKKNQLEEVERQRIADIKAKEDEKERKRLADIAAEQAKQKAELEQKEKTESLKFTFEQLVYARTGYIIPCESNDLELFTAPTKSIAELENDFLSLKADCNHIPSLVEFIASLEKNELQRIEAINAEAERRRKADEAVEAERVRKTEEDKKLKEEARLSQMRAEATATVQATGQSVSAMVDTQANLFTEAPKVKEGYNIKVLNPAGYLQLISFWFENEGKTLTNDKIETMSITRIKAFCEKYAVKNDVTIESKLLVYEPVYKAK